MAFANDCSWSLVPSGAGKAEKACLKPKPEDLPGWPYKSHGFLAYCAGSVLFSELTGEARAAEKLKKGLFVLESCCFVQQPSSLRLFLLCSVWPMPVFAGTGFFYAEQLSRKNILRKEDEK